MVAPNPHRDKYFPMDNSKLIECNTLDHNTFLCSNTQAIFSKGAPIYSCEIHLFNNESDSSCNIELIVNNNVWHQLYKENHWLVATKQQIKYSVQRKK